MYHKEIESDKVAALANAATLKKNAADRLKANAEYNRKQKRG